MLDVGPIYSIWFKLWITWNEPVYNFEISFRRGLIVMAVELLFPYQNLTDKKFIAAITCKLPSEYF